MSHLSDDNEITIHPLRPSGSRSQSSLMLLLLPNYSSSPAHLASLPFLQTFFPTLFLRAWTSAVALQVVPTPLPSSLNPDPSSSASSGLSLPFWLLLHYARSTIFCLIPEITTLCAISRLLFPASPPLGLHLSLWPPV